MLLEEILPKSSNIEKIAETVERVAEDLTLAVCAYNAGATVEETLRSVAAQTVWPGRLIVVDDASTDDTRSVVERVCAALSLPLTLICQPRNGGIALARRTAERAADTPLMMFVDADDLLLPQAIERMHSVISSDHRRMAVGCYLDYIDADGKRIGGGLYLGSPDVDEALGRAARGKLFFMQPTAIYRRDDSLRVGGYTAEEFETVDHRTGRTIRWRDHCEDLDLWTRMSDLYTEGKAVTVIPEVLALYRKTGSGLSAQSLPMLLKMRWVKRNVKARRAGGCELSFAEFYRSLTPLQIRELERDATAADQLRAAAAAFRSRRILRAVTHAMRSLWARPGYIPQKIRANLIKKHG